jgi:hypothetical protein
MSDKLVLIDVERWTRHLKLPFSTLLAVAPSLPPMISINGLPSRSITLALVLGASGCVRTVQAWPPPLTEGTAVRVHFATPRLVVYERGQLQDSVSGVPELRGLVVALRGDTLVLRVTSDRGDTTGKSGETERQTTLVLDQSTTVSRTEIDGWKLSYALLAGSVLIFAALVMSGG